MTFTIQVLFYVATGETANMNTHTKILDEGHLQSVKIFFYTNTFQ